MVHAGTLTDIKGTVFDIKRYALHDGPGIRVSVHLKGCPLRCAWCHNPESQSFEPQTLFRPERCIRCGSCKGLDEAGAAGVCPPEARELCGREMTVPEVMKHIMKERLFFDQSGGGVTVTGGEPLSQPDFTSALLAACRANRVHTAVDTSGFVGWSAFEAAIPHTELFLYDVKLMDPAKHKEYTGVDNDVILRNLERLGESGARIFARMPFIPGVNSDEENVRATAEFLKGVRGVEQINLLPYHSAAEDKHNRWGMEFRLKGVFPPASASLRKAADIFEKHGIKAVIGG